MTESTLRHCMTALGASLFQRGFASGSGGNLSLRLPDGNILATPTNSSLGRLLPERLSKVSPTGERISGDPPSKECALHMALYQNRSDCGAVVHLHSPHAVALSCCQGLDERDALRPFTPYYAMKVAPLPLLPYHEPGSLDLVRELTAKSHQARSFLLANHGSLVSGKTLEDAVNIAEELEETARLYFLLHGSGQRVRYLTEAEIRALDTARYQPESA